MMVKKPQKILLFRNSAYAEFRNSYFETPTPPIPEQLGFLRFFGRIARNSRKS
jgi:hypothetical protein